MISIKHGKLLIDMYWNILVDVLHNFNVKEVAWILKPSIGRIFSSDNFRSGHMSADDYRLVAIIAIIPIIAINCSYCQNCEVIKSIIVIILVIINRPGVAGAVLHTASLLIKSVTQPFPPDLHNIINHKR